MRHSAIKLIAGLVTAALTCGPLACKTTSHKSVRTYEYGEEVEPDRQQTDELDEDYKMVSPGEMTGPGEMVSPGSTVEE